MERKRRSTPLIIFPIIAVVIIAAVVILLLINGKVSIGSESVNRNVQELTLSEGDYDTDALIKALPQLKKLTKISFPETELSAEELDRIRSAADGVEIDFTLDIGGKTYDQTCTKLDLSELDSEQLLQAAPKLALLPELSEIELMSSSGSSALSIADVKQLTEKLPNVKVHYEFDLFGKHISTQDERVEYVDVKIGNEGVDEIREALSIMSGCSYLLLDTCGIDDEEMAALRDEFPDKKIVWRIYLKSIFPEDHYDFLTDEQALRITYNLDDSNCHQLDYCTECVYLDVGHNESLTDISFVSHMPKLECIIAGGSPISDLTPFKNCQNLTWMELGWCGLITDISPLKDIPSLRYLNIGFTGVSDLSPLNDLHLERLTAMGTDIPKKASSAFEKDHPDCLCVFEGSQPYGYGWRYNDEGYTFFDYYVHMREVFHYDAQDYHGNTKTSEFCPIYLKDYEGYPWYEWQK